MRHSVRWSALGGCPAPPPLTGPAIQAGLQEGAAGLWLPFHDVNAEGHMASSSAGVRARLILLCAAISAAISCRTQTINDSRPRGGQFVGAARIAESNARTAWDALRLNVSGITFLESGRTGAPARMRRRGTSSLLLGDHPLLYIDDVRVADIGILRTMPAGDLESIRVLSGIDATTYYGTNAGDGVILLRTRAVVRE